MPGVGSHRRRLRLDATSPADAAFTFLDRADQDRHEDRGRPNVGNQQGQQDDDDAHDLMDRSPVVTRSEDPVHRVHPRGLEAGMGRDEPERDADQHQMRDLVREKQGSGTRGPGPSEVLDRLGTFVPRSRSLV